MSNWLKSFSRFFYYIIKRAKKWTNVDINLDRIIFYVNTSNDSKGMKMMPRCKLNIPFIHSRFSFLRISEDDSCLRGSTVLIFLDRMDATGCARTPLKNHRFFAHRRLLVEQSLVLTVKWSACNACKKRNMYGIKIRVLYMCAHARRGWDDP